LSSGAVDVAGENGDAARETIMHCMWQRHGEAMMDDDISEVRVILHRTEWVSPGVIVGYSDDFPDKKFLIILDPEAVKGETHV